LRLRETAYDDPWHDLWNAVKKAAGYKQLLGVMKLFAVNHSIPHGPWESSSAFAEIRDSALELKAVTKPGDALLASRIRGILLDKGHFRGVTAASQQEFLDGLEDMPFVRIRGPRSNLTRWWSWMAAQDWYDSQWNARGWVLTHTCIKRREIALNAPHKALALVPLATCASGASSSKDTVAVDAAVPAAKADGKQTVAAATKDV
jgi:hypothetical protein